MPPTSPLLLTATQTPGPTGFNFHYVSDSSPWLTTALLQILLFPSSLVSFTPLRFSLDPSLRLLLEKFIKNPNWFMQIFCLNLFFHCFISSTQIISAEDQGLHVRSMHNVGNVAWTRPTGSPCPQSFAFTIEFTLIWLTWSSKMRLLTTIGASFLTVPVSNITSAAHLFIVPCIRHALSHLCDFLLLTLSPPLPLDLLLSMHSLRESLSLTHSGWVKYSSTVLLCNTYIPHHRIHSIVNICTHIWTQFILGTSSSRQTFIYQLPNSNIMAHIFYHKFRKKLMAKRCGY